MRQSDKVVRQRDHLSKAAIFTTFNRDAVLHSRHQTSIGHMLPRVAFHCRYRNQDMINSYFLNETSLSNRRLSRELCDFLCQSGSFRLSSNISQHWNVAAEKNKLNLFILLMCNHITPAATTCSPHRNTTLTSADFSATAGSQILSVTQSVALVSKI